VGVTVRFLGTGDAFNARGRCHASYLVSSPAYSLLLDCGSSALLAMKRDGLSVEALDAVFLSHLHGDHFSGLPFFFLNWNFETRRQRPLTIVGPPGTAERVQDLYRAMYRDLSALPMPFEVEYREVRGNQEVSLGPLRLVPFPVPHQQSEISLGVRIAVEDKSVLYSGDTGWTEALVEHSQGTDLFICECCYYDVRTTFHLDYPRIREQRERFGCRRLILSHLGREVLARRGEIDSELADDGLTVAL
jgi:ribonuclease BN (tRNA processing enzyme)